LNISKQEMRFRAFEVRFVFTTFFALILLCAVLSSCTQGTEEPATPVESKDKEAEQKTKLRIPAQVVKKQSLAKTLTASGVVMAEPDHLIKVTSAIAGKLVSVDVVLGQHVKKGQVIAELDDRHIKEQLDQSSSALKTAEANVIQIEGNLKFAEENLVRQKKLFEAEVAPQKDVIAAENQIENLKAQLDSVKSQVRTAQSARDQIATELTFTKVSTPIDGVVSNRFLNKGNTADPNTPIVQVVDLDNVIIEASVPADNRVSVKPGDHAKISSVSDPDTIFDGKVTYISPVVDSASDTFKITLSSKNPAWRLKEGQAVSVAIDTGVDYAILLPASALVPDTDKPAEFLVYVLKDGKAKRVPIVRGASQNGLVEIVSGLKVGDIVLTREVYGLPEDTEVEAVLSP
jgi:RND family efflux transporter MFP subunit